MADIADKYGLIPFGTNIFKVLVVEDQVTNQMLIYKWLKKMGFQAIDVAQDGINALEHVEDIKYDIILMDCQMPGLDGYQATQIIREAEKETARCVPIIAMTANTTVRNKERCLAAGMADIICKPVQFNLLYETICANLPKTDESAASPLPEIIKPAYKDEDRNTLSPVDPARLKEFTDGNKALQGSLVKIFIEEGLEKIRIIEENYIQNSKESWAAAIHSLKGASGNLGANRLYTLCVQAEQPSTDNKTMEDFLLREIKNEFSAVNDFLRSL